MSDRQLLVHSAPEAYSIKKNLCVKESSADSITYLWLIQQQYCNKLKNLLHFFLEIYLDVKIVDNKLEMHAVDLLKLLAFITLVYTCTYIWYKVWLFEFFATNGQQLSTSSKYLWSTNITSICKCVCFSAMYIPEPWWDCKNTQVWFHRTFKNTVIANLLIMNWC